MYQALLVQTTCPQTGDWLQCITCFFPILIQDHVAMNRTSFLELVCHITAKASTGKWFMNTLCVEDHQR